MTITEETQQALNYLRETILDLFDLFELKDARIAELERQLDQAKARIEELAPPVYREPKSGRIHPY